MRVALGQLASGTDIAGNLAAIDVLAGRAAAEGVGLIAFPEYSTYEKKIVDASFPRVAESLDGPICTELARIAQSHSIALVAGVVEAAPPHDRAYNTLVAFDSGGERIAAYRKVHLFDAQNFHESAHIEPSPSTDPVVFTVNEIRFGLMTCYDLRFPEIGRALSDAGAEILLVCSSWVPGDHKTRQWQTLLAARAIENGLYAIGVSQAAPVSIGHSLVADPMGTVMCELGQAPDLVFAELSTRAIARVRENFPTYRQRRIL